MVSPKDGKRYLTDVADAEQLFRIIQSIPSPKAEPFKQWLARVGYERIQEIENPELAQERMKAVYEAKGYPKDWIDKRLRGIAIRQNLTDEWKERGITEQRDYAILTAEIAKATFGITPSEHKEIKGLTKKSLLMADDIANLVNLAKDKGGVFNVCDDYNPSFGELSKVMAKQLGKHAPISVPYWMAWCLAKIGDVLGDIWPINSQRLGKIVTDDTISNEKAKRELGWQPMDVLTNYKI